MRYTGYVTIFILVFLLFLPLSSASGEFTFDFVSGVPTKDNTAVSKHWSSTYPPDPNADIIIYSGAFNQSYKRLSALGFIYVIYDPMNNIVAVEKITSFKRSYDPNIVYYTLHPKTDWIEGNYKISIIVFDMIDREAFDDRITDDPFAIGIDPDKYKIFYDTGANAKDLGVLRDLGDPVARASLNFKIDKKATLYPPDRFLLHDAIFVDNINERIFGEKFKIQVKIDNNYKDDGEFKLAMLVDNNVIATKDVTVAGLNTSVVTFEARASKLGTFKVGFGADTQDVKYRNAELTFTIKNESETTRLPDEPQITITGMNVNKEFAGIGDNVIVTVTAINNGKNGSRNIIVYSNRGQIGTSQVNLKYLEEKSVEIPVTMKTMGVNKITVSDAPALFRNVFVTDTGESGSSTMGVDLILSRVKENSLKVSIVFIFIIFAGMLYYIRNRLGDQATANASPQIIKESHEDNRISDLRNKLTESIKELSIKMKAIMKKKPGK